jgi:hypothetical protein
MVSAVEACARVAAGAVGLCWLEALAPRSGDAPAGGERALVLLAPTAPFDPHVFRLPSAAALVRGRQDSPPPQRTSLPAESLALRLDATFLEEARAGWKITALDMAALEAARALAEDLADARTYGGNAPELAVWIAPRPLRRAALEVEGAFENLPLADPDDARSWRLAGELLARLESVDAITALAGSDRIVVRWTRRSAPPAATP